MRKENKLEVSLIQIFLIAIIVLVTLVLPAQYIQYNRQLEQQSNTPYTADSIRQQQSEANTNQGRVAGESIERSSQLVRIPFTTTYLDLSTEAGKLTLAGTILVGISMLIFIFLVFSGKNP